MQHTWNKIFSKILEKVKKKKKKKKPDHLKFRVSSFQSPSKQSVNVEIT